MLLKVKPAPTPAPAAAPEAQGTLILYKPKLSLVKPFSTYASALSAFVSSRAPAVAMDPDVRQILDTFAQLTNYEQAGTVKADQPDRRTGQTVFKVDSGTG